jgi:cytochrome c oxidase subunit 4
MALTILTVWVAYYDLGSWNVIVALSIAVLKGTLVVLYFMHVRYSSKLTWVFVCAGFLWLLILFALTLSDYFTRSWVPIGS